MFKFINMFKSVISYFRVTTADKHISALWLSLTFFVPPLSSLRRWKTVCVSWGTCHTVWLQRRPKASRGAPRSWMVCYVTLVERMQKVQDAGARRRRKRRDMTRWDWCHFLTHMSLYRGGFYRDWWHKNESKIKPEAHALPSCGGLQKQLYNPSSFRRKSKGTWNSFNLVALINTRYLLHLQWRHLKFSICCFSSQFFLNIQFFTSSLVASDPPPTHTHTHNHACISSCAFLSPFSFLITPQIDFCSFQQASC